MATIKDTLALEDRISSQMNIITRSMENASVEADYALRSIKALEEEQAKWKALLTNASKQNDLNAESYKRISDKVDAHEKELYKLNATFIKSAQAVDKYDKQLDKLKKDLDDTKGKSIMLGSALGSFIGNIGANLFSSAMSGLKNSVGTAIETASNLAEVQNVVDVAFGNSAQEINNWSKTALTQYGLNELSAKKYASTMGAMLKSSGIAGDKVVEMSEKITALSGDMASFYNLQNDEAFNKIRSGIAGEVMALKSLGINMSTANLDQFALASGLGKTTSKMTEQEKIMLRYNYLLSVTKDAQGDFTRTSASFANQQKLMQENWLQVSSAIAGVFIPIMTTVMSVFNNIMSQSDFVEKTLENLYIVLSMVATGITYVGLQSMWAGREAMLAGLKTAGAWVMANLPLLAVIGTVGTLMVVFIKFNKVIENVLNWCIDKFFAFNNVVISIIRNIALAIDSVFKTNLVSGVDKLQALSNKGQEMAKKGTHNMQQWLENIGKTDITAKITGGADALAKANNDPLSKYSDGKALKTKQQGKMELKEEDVQMLNDLASRDFMLRYQALSPTVNFGNVTVNENADFNSMLGQLDTWVAEQANNNLSVGNGQ